MSAFTVSQTDFIFITLNIIYHLTATTIVCPKYRALPWLLISMSPTPRAISMCRKNERKRTRSCQTPSSTGLWHKKYLHEQNLQKISSNFVM